VGLLEIGKPWGHVPSAVPEESKAIEFLEFAFESGIRYFDSAASYAVAEQRFGKFLQSLTPAQRGTVTVATKFGEHWDFEKDEPYVDHSFEGLARSLGNSMRLLGKIDVLQLHKATPEVLRSGDLERAWELAGSFGIGILGPSVSDLDSARIALESRRYQMMQLPFNMEFQKFQDVIPQASAQGMYLAVNRPFAMGKLLYSEGQESAHEKRVAALAFVLKQRFRGVVLTGTKTKAHLMENQQAFAEAVQLCMTHSHN
jgi:aryl-alcohol dehydrogenase-like predicted oxidoreductase